LCLIAGPVVFPDGEDLARQVDIQYAIAALDPLHLEKTTGPALS